MTVNKYIPDNNFFRWQGPSEITSEDFVGGLEAVSKEKIKLFKEADEKTIFGKRAKELKYPENAGFFKKKGISRVMRSKEAQDTAIVAPRSAGAGSPIVWAVRAPARPIERVMIIFIKLENTTTPGCVMDQ